MLFFALLIFFAVEFYDKLNKEQIPLKLKYQIDQTLWLQATLFLFTLASIALTFFSDVSLLITLPFIIIGLVSSLVSIQWRAKYKKVLKESKAIFTNPLMSYLYSGSNDAVGTIQLALAMQKAEINAVVGRVSDVSLHVNKNAVDTSKQNEQVSQDSVSYTHLTLPTIYSV